MKNTNNFLPGFRISVIDVIVLVIGISASILAAKFEIWLGIVIIFIVLNFFLFCNVFRIARVLELIWAGFFIAISSCTILINTPTWIVTMSMSFIITCVLVTIQILNHSYHGIFWGKLNKNLFQWWQLKKNK